MTNKINQKPEKEKTERQRRIRVFEKSIELEKKLDENLSKSDTENRVDCLKGGIWPNRNFWVPENHKNKHLEKITGFFRRGPENYEGFDYCELVNKNWDREGYKSELNILLKNQEKQYKKHNRFFGGDWYKAEKTKELCEDLNEYLDKFREEQEQPKPYEDSRSERLDEMKKYLTVAFSSDKYKQLDERREEIK